MCNNSPTRGTERPRALTRMKRFAYQKVVDGRDATRAERVRAGQVRCVCRLRLDRGFERPFDSTIWQMDMLSIICCGSRAT